MHRSVLRVVVLGLVVALSVGVATAYAGGGNSANAKLCQNNGWTKVFTSAAQTFSGEAACVSYGAQGGKYSQASLVFTDTIDIDCGPCFGVLTGTGLAPNAEVDVYQGSVIVGVGFADANGNYAPSPVGFGCGHGENDGYATSTTAGGQPITSNTINSPCE